jgi:hypothetical protein
VKDPHREDRAPDRTDEGRAPEPERPVPGTERRRGDGQPDRPSQAEGEREDG